MDYNVVYAQMGQRKDGTQCGILPSPPSRERSPRWLSMPACSIARTSRFVKRLPKECTTGSSIMPHKKNPGCIRAHPRQKQQVAKSLPQQVMLIMNNLPVGYFRDLQIIKEVFLPAFDELKDCLQMAAYIINKIEVNEHILDNPMYDPMFSVEEVNRSGCQMAHPSVMLIRRWVST
jgi:argininosuccinate lyase